MNRTIEENINIYESKKQHAYMQEVKQCVLRVDEKCGFTSSCKICPHYLMVQKFREELKNVSTEDGKLVNDWHCVGAGFPMSEVELYMDGFDVPRDK